MKRLSLRILIALLLIFIPCLTFVSDAQTAYQHALVKTRGKQDQKGKVIPGKRISGAVVKIKDGNFHKSDAAGHLSFPVSGGRYYIESVRYEDYVLYDPEQFNKEQLYSKDTKPILIASAWEMNEDRINEEMRMAEQAASGIEKV